MNIDLKLLSRAEALLSEARGIVERVEQKAKEINEGSADEAKIAEISALVDRMESIGNEINRLTRE